MSGIDWLCGFLARWSIIAIVGVAAGLMIASMWFGIEASRDNFTQVCKTAGGTAVFNGLQWQCLKPNLEPKT